MQVLVCANFVDAAEIQYLGGLKCPSDAAEITLEDSSAHLTLRRLP